MPSVVRDGVELHYEVVGTGPAVILHTGGAGSGVMWRDGGYIEQLSGFSLVLLDHRGRGRSDRPAAPEQHRMAEYAADVSALADRLGLTRYGFVGYSLGGGVGFRVAHTDGRLAALVVLGCVFAPPGHAEPRRRVEAPQMSEVIGAIEAEEQITLPDWLRADFLSTDAHQFAVSVEAMAEDGDPWPLLADLNVPVALIAGSDEDPDGVQDEMASAMPSAVSVHLDGVGHVGAFLRPADVVAAALPVLRTLHAS